MRTSSPRTCLRCCRLRGASSSSKKATSRRYAATAVRVIDRRRQQCRRAPVRESELTADAAEKGQYRALHAEGDPRAAPCGGQHAAERVANGACSSRPSALRPPRSSKHRARAHRGLRHQLSRRLRGAYFIEQICRIPARSRSPASIAIAIRWCRRTPCSSPSRSPVKPRTRWRRCAWPSRRLPPRSRSATPGKFAGARVRTRDADPRRSRRSASLPPRPSRRSSRRCACW
jgi:hypothetical protein